VSHNNKKSIISIFKDNKNYKLKLNLLILVI